MTWVKTPEDRRRDAQVYGAEWRRKRLACLRRAGWKCEIRLEGCAGAATQADHIDQAASDPNHERLRAGCTPCHRKVTAQQGGGWRNRRSAADPSPRPSTAW